MAQLDLNIVIEVKGASQASKAVEGVSKSAEGVGAATKDATKKTASMQDALKKMAGAFGVYKGADYIKDATKMTADLVGSTKSLQRITGLDSKTASGWIGIAKQRGIETKTLNMGFTALARNINQAAAGSKKAAGAFQKLGVSEAAIKKHDLPTVLNQVADGFKAMPAGADTAALSQQLFGRAAQSLLPIINQGSKAINGQTSAMAKSLGITDKTAQETLKMIATQREFKATMMGLQVAVATAVIPVLNAVLKVITPLAKKFSEAMQSSDLFRWAIVGLTGALLGMFVITKLTNEVKAFNQAIGAFGKARKSAEGGRRGLAKMMAGPMKWIVLAAAIIAGLVLLYNKVAWFRDAVNAVWGAIVAGATWMWNAIKTIFGWIGDHWKTLIVMIMGPMGFLVVFIVNNWNVIWNAIKTVFNAIAAFLLIALVAVYYIGERTPGPPARAAAPGTPSTPLPVPAQAPGPAPAPNGSALRRR